MRWGTELSAPTEPSGPRCRASPSAGRRGRGRSDSCTPEPGARGPGHLSSLPRVSRLERNPRLFRRSGMFNSISGAGCCDHSVKSHPQAHPPRQTRLRNKPFWPFLSFCIDSPFPRVPCVTRTIAGRRAISAKASITKKSGTSTMVCAPCRFIFATTLGVGWGDCDHVMSPEPRSDRLGSHPGPGLQGPRGHRA